jgi:hypothetical protein
MPRELAAGMRIIRNTLLMVTLVGGGVAFADSSTTDKRPAKEKKQQAEKKGALKERVDPKADLAAQKKNEAQLKENIALEKKNGNHIAAWAAEGDLKHAQKLEKKDETLIQKGEKKHTVDGQSTTTRK